MFALASTLTISSPASFGAGFGRGIGFLVFAAVFFAGFAFLAGFAFFEDLAFLAGFAFALVLVCFAFFAFFAIAPPSNNWIRLNSINDCVAVTMVRDGLRPPGGY
jgi:hypothetical protein